MLKQQNRSHAVMAQRYEGSASVDDFPTPPWATRALIEHVLNASEVGALSCMEPACGRGYMSEVLKEYFQKVYSSDVVDYGYSERVDFLSRDIVNKTDWMITNPPFKFAEEFIVKGMKCTRKGVAVLVRTVFLESIGRYNRLFSKYPPTQVAQFVQRVPIVKGRVDKKASSATGYAWLIWEKVDSKETKVVWIPPCRKQLERETDYFIPPLKST